MSIISYSKLLNGKYEGKLMNRSRKQNSKYDKTVYRSIILITQFGINMLVPICMMSALGIWLDNRYHTSFWTILLFFAGAFAGGQNIYRMARKVYDTDGRKESDTSDEDCRDIEK